MSKGTFLNKNTIFFEKMLISAKSKNPKYEKIYFLKLHMDVYVSAKFEVYRIILTSFIQEEGGR